MAYPNRSDLEKPSKSACEALLVLVEAQQRAESATLTLQQAGALLTHLRHALGIALAPTPAEQRSADRTLLRGAMLALQHVRHCGACGEDSWESCASGGQHAAKTLAAIEWTLVLPPSVDARPHGDLRENPDTKGSQQ